MTPGPTTLAVLLVLLILACLPFRPATRSFGSGPSFFFGMLLAILIAMLVLEH